MSDRPPQADYAAFDSGQRYHLENVAGLCYSDVSAEKNSLFLSSTFVLILDNAGGIIG